MNVFFWSQESTILVLFNVKQLVILTKVSTVQRDDLQIIIIDT